MKSENNFRVKYFRKKKETLKISLFACLSILSKLSKLWHSQRNQNPIGFGFLGSMLPVELESCNLVWSGVLGTVYLLRKTILGRKCPNKFFLFYLLITSFFSNVGERGGQKSILYCSSTPSWFTSGRIRITCCTKIFKNNNNAYSAKSFFNIYRIQFVLVTQLGV